MKKRVLISGASVAGPALAFWLSRYGFDVTVVERAPGIRPGGYAVDFRGTATRVLERMGLVEAVKEHETRAGSITMVNQDNKVVAKLPDGFTSGELEILRGDLAQVFYEATRNSAEYIFDDSIQSMTETADGVEVSFVSGKMRSFEFVVGADGLHSNVRAIAFGEEARFVHPMGYYIAIFSIPDYLNLGNGGKYYVELGRRVGLFRNADTRRCQGVVLLHVSEAGLSAARRGWTEEPAAREICRHEVGNAAHVGTVGCGSGSLFRFNQPGQDGQVVQRTDRAARRCGMLPVADGGDGYQHRRGGSLRAC